MILDQTDKNAKALLDKHPTCEFVVGDTYQSLRWKSKDITKPTEEEFNEIVSTWEKTFSDNQYQRDRKREYPSIQECVHAILDDDLDALQAKRAEIKTKYPKGD